MFKRSFFLSFIVIVLLSCTFDAGIPEEEENPEDTLKTTKVLSAFSFSKASNTSLSEDVIGIIQGSNITATVPSGTDVKTLKASFTITGVSVSVNGTIQTSGATANDFTNPVTYQVKAEDGSTKDYSITVTVKTSPEVTDKDITAFSFAASANSGLSADIKGVIDGLTITAAVPYKTDLKALKASFTTTGVSVSVNGTAQTSGTTANDFTNPVVYRVTAADGSAQDYTVTVTAGKSTDKDLTSFCFETSSNSQLSSNVTGIISGTEVTAEVPRGTDVKTLKASFSTNGVSVTVNGLTQESGITANDFTNSLAYRIKAADGSTKDYTVKVTVQKSAGKELTYFGFTAAANSDLSSDITTAINGTNITATIPYGPYISSLKASFTTTGTSVTVAGTAQTSGITPNNFNNPVIYCVTAEDGTYQNYTVTLTLKVTREQLLEMIAAGKNVTKVDTSDITDMSSLFLDNASFDQDISGWDVSNVTTMKSMFKNASSFTQDISSWDVSKVTDMSLMFQGAVKFNQPIGEWDVANVTNMMGMFFDNEVFNGPIGSWNVSKVTNMSFMFYSSIGEAAFNQDISGWNTANVTDMSYMFVNARDFNQPIGSWNTANVTNMYCMFMSANSFNADISGWNTAKVTNMNSMFRAAWRFNQDIGGWDVSNVTDMGYMFDEAGDFNQGIGSWNVAKVTTMEQMFSSADEFNQDISGWNVSMVSDMNNMFAQADAFNQNLSSWSSHVAEDIVYYGFSYGSCPLVITYHPYESWDN